MSKFLKGLSPIIIVVVLAVLAVGGYLLYKSGALPTGGGLGVSQRVTEKDFEFVSDPLLRKNFVAQANANEVRSVTQSSGKGTKDTTEYQVKGDNFSYRMKEEDGEKEISHTIIIGDTTYIKDYSDNSWWKQTAKPEETEEVADTPEDLKESLMMEDPSLYKNLGTEACGNLTCHKYEQTFKEFPGKRTFWFDTKKFLLRKEESAYGEFTSTVEYSYDGINISAPSPTKDVPEGRNIYEYSTGGGYSPPVDTSQGTPSEDMVPSDFNLDDYNVPDYSDFGY
jgi:hypothetical protein